MADVTSGAGLEQTGPEENNRHGYSQPTLAMYEESRRETAMALRMHDVQFERANRLQERIDRVIAFRNDALDTSQSPWLGKEIVSALDEALRSS